MRWLWLFIVSILCLLLITYAWHACRMLWYGYHKYSFYNETMTGPCSHVWSYNDETMTCLYVMMVRCLVYEVVLMKQWHVCMVVMIRGLWHVVVNTYIGRHGPWLHAYTCTCIMRPWHVVMVCCLMYVMARCLM